MSNRKEIINNFYNNNCEEDTRLESQHGQVEFITTTKYVEKFLKPDSKILNDFLDELIPVKYYLEVSSPGLERKFKSDKEFIIFKGRRISIKCKM